MPEVYQEGIRKSNLPCSLRGLATDKFRKQLAVWRALEILIYIEANQHLLDGLPLNKLGRACPA
jgi:hypothetical protein